MKMLQAKLYDAERERQARERAAERKGQVGSGDRSERIRTYNFPQGRVTDHRINLTVYNLPEVIDGGGLDPILDALAAEEQARKLAALEDDSVSTALGRRSGPTCAAASKRRAWIARCSTRVCWWKRARACRGSTSSPIRAANSAKRKSPPCGRSPTRRAAREPMAHIIGAQAFLEASIAVRPDVLIPRPETELLVEAALQALPLAKRPRACLILASARAPFCWRSWPIGRSRPALGVDLSAAALDHGAGQCGGAGLWTAAPRFSLADWAQAAKAISTSSSPTRPTSRPPTSMASTRSRRFEPRLALDGGADGLAPTASLSRHCRPVAPGGAFALGGGAGPSRSGSQFGSRGRAQGCAAPPRLQWHRPRGRRRCPAEKTPVNDTHRCPVLLAL